MNKPEVLFKIDWKLPSQVRSWEGEFRAKIKALKDAHNRSAEKNNLIKLGFADTLNSLVEYYIQRRRIKNAATKSAFKLTKTYLKHRAARTIYNHIARLINAGIIEAKQYSTSAFGRAKKPIFCLMLVWSAEVVPMHEREAEEEREIFAMGEHDTLGLMLSIAKKLKKNMPSYKNLRV